MEKELRMDAYYYGFNGTGVRVVDQILSKVAIAGKMYHSTEDWNDTDDGDPSPVDYIQDAACEAAEKIKELEKCLKRIKNWCDAYPIEIFPEPDFKKAAKVLKDNGMTIDSISASAMRHITEGIKEIINESNI